jgi:arsenite-transporting ATPase
MDLLERRLLLVTGKGGTGKTTVAAALARLAARSGRRVLLAEIAGERLSTLFGRPPVGHHETPVGDGISLLSIDPIVAAHEFLRGQVGGAVHRLMFQNRLFDVTMTAAPGLREVCTMDRVWDLARDDRGRRQPTYDLVILDAAATGHAMAMLRAPTTYANLARGGPIRNRADQIDALVRDRQRSAVVLCALPEETPVNETLETVGQLDALRIAVGLTVVNQVRATTIDDPTAEALATVAADPPAGPDGAVAARVAAPVVVAHRRARREAAQISRLADAVAARGPLVALPRIDGDLGRTELDAIADRLAVA